jgi:hypothetical protein
MYLVWVSGSVSTQQTKATRLTRNWVLFLDLHWEKATSPPDVRMVSGGRGCDHIHVTLRVTVRVTGAKSWISTGGSKSLHWARPIRI